VFVGEEGEGGLWMVFVKRNVLCFVYKRVHSSTNYIGATKFKTQIQNYVPNIYIYFLLLLLLFF
jgi:hypothetical protein